MGLPSHTVPKPHWVESPIWSRGKYRAASSMRLVTSSTGSSLVRLVEMSPSTTPLSLGMSLRGSNEPERQSSYSSKNRLKLRARVKTCLATASYPPSPT
jgi:hypothetical protein